MTEADRRGEPRGRPRNPKADAAVLTAALDELEAVGYGRLTMDAVARRAGVGRPTVYRRHATKGALVIAACRDIAARYVQAPDTGSLLGDLTELLGGLAWVFTHTRARRIIPGLLAAGEGEPDLAEAARAVSLPRRAAVFEVLGRAMTRGELDASLDLELAADLLYAPLYYRLLVTGAPLDRDVAARIAALAVAGLPTGGGGGGAGGGGGGGGGGGE